MPTSTSSNVTDRPNETSEAQEPSNLPPVLSGPIVRHLGEHRLLLWLATSSDTECDVGLWANGVRLNSVSVDAEASHRIPVGRHCYLQWVSVNIEEPLPVDEVLEYEVFLGGESQGLSDRLDGLCYPDRHRPSLVFKRRANHILHGSCRKPHHPSPDGLLQADTLLSKTVADAAERPALLMLTGDQIYADDVAGPMLVAIHQLIDRLGLFEEQFDGASVGTSKELRHSEYSYYQREQLLPHTRENRQLLAMFFGGARKPIFTAAGAHNHLVTFSEVIAMYLLVWSPECWSLVDMRMPEAEISAQYHSRYREEQRQLEQFIEGLPAIRRALAHVPVYMIFDDHDITDDWNLSRGWEEAAYENPFSRRIIGNALAGYWLCQGWGNVPGQFRTLEASLLPRFTVNGIEQQDALVDELLEWENWHYTIRTDPKIVVLDTRTHRWRSESSAVRPSGLMDWESLTDLQQELMEEETVIMVSPSPIFGVKFIEAVQRVFSFFGKALLVDAENWMAHPGAANVMLNIFRHKKTPPHFFILSGDVHYSFVYDITLRHRTNSPKIFQITASGLKNRFPERLLIWFDRINQLLYNRRSPLNLFTKRRNMSIQRRVPDKGVDAPFYRPLLYNQTGLGQVRWSGENNELEVNVLSENGTVNFPAPSED